MRGDRFAVARRHDEGLDFPIAMMASKGDAEWLSEILDIANTDRASVFEIVTIPDWKDKTKPEIVQELTKMGFRLQHRKMRHRTR